MRSIRSMLTAVFVFASVFGTLRADTALYRPAASTSARVTTIDGRCENLRTARQRCCDVLGRGEQVLYLLRTAGKVRL